MTTTRRFFTTIFLTLLVASMACGSSAASARAKTKEAKSRAVSALEGTNQMDGIVAVVRNGHPALEWKASSEIGMSIVYARRGGQEGLDFTVAHLHGRMGTTETVGHLFITSQRIVWQPELSAKHKDSPFAFARSEITSPPHSWDDFRADGRNYSFIDAYEDAKGVEFTTVLLKDYCKEQMLDGRSCKRIRNAVNTQIEANDFRGFGDLERLAVSNFNSALNRFEALTGNLSVPLPPNQAALVTSKEAAGDSAAQAGKLYDALQDYLAAFQMLPTHWAGDIEGPLTKQIIKLVVRMNPPPAIPQKAMQHEAYAMTAFREATGPQDLLRAAGELQKALRLAPWWGDAYKNLGLLDAKAGHFADAARNLQLYLLAAPNASDAQSMQMKIYSLQYQAKHPPYLGVRITNVSPELVKRFSLPDSTGAYVQQVVAGSPAAEAGLKQGDVIRTFNGLTVSSYPALPQMILTTRAGTSVTLGIIRDGKPMSLPAQIGARP